MPAPGLSPAARARRQTLAETMTSAGFVNYPTEWWHWSFGDRYWAAMTAAPAAIYGPVRSWPGCMSGLIAADPPESFQCGFWIIATLNQACFNWVGRHSAKATLVSPYIGRRPGDYLPPAGRLSVMVSSGMSPEFTRSSLRSPGNAAMVLRKGTGP
jgi:hypothetical protein